MISSKVLLAMINETGGVAAGRARARATRKATTAAQRKFLADWNELQTKDPAAPGKYVHPERSKTERRRADGPLTPFELAWLQRLPSDPSQVTHRDAVVLAQIANTMDRIRFDEVTLLDSYWGPVKEYHDIQAAAADLAIADVPPPMVPSSLVAAVADALRAEHDQLTDEEAAARATGLVHQALDARADAHAEHRADVERTFAHAQMTAEARGAVSSDLSASMTEMKRRYVLQRLESALKRVPGERRSVIIENLDLGKFVRPGGDVDDAAIRNLVAVATGQATSVDASTARGPEHLVHQ